jgi:serine/threonine protein kinase, bacterial
MSTQIQPAAPNDDEPTAIVADDKATVLAGLAWSDDTEDYDEAFDELRDRTTLWLRLFVATATAVVLVLGVVLWFVLSDHHEPAAAVAAPAPSTPDVAPIPSGPDDKIVPSAVAPAPPPIAAPPPEPTQTVTVTPTPALAAPPPVQTVQTVAPPRPTVAAPPRSGADEAFIAALREDGIIVTNPAEIIGGAHRACEYIAAGHTAHDTMRLAIAENPTLTPENASILIGAAIGAYCPQYTGR